MKTWTKTLIGVAALAVVAGGVAQARGPGGPACDGPAAWGGPGWGGHGWAGPMKDGAGMPGRGPMIDRMFDRLDADKDGAVTLAEAITVVDKRFDAIDANHDGVVDKAEIEAWVGRAHPKAVDHFLAVHDLDGDGKVTKAEFEKPAKKLFALFDRNDDGRVTRAEAEQAAAMMPMGHRRGGPGMMGPGWGGMNPPPLPGTAPAAPPAAPAK